MTENMAAAAVGSGTPAAGAGRSSCPAWCTEQVSHDDSGSHVHRSEGLQIPVTPHWWCQDMHGSGADLRCTTDDGIVAFLTMTDDGSTEVVLQHGDMELPHFTLQAAEELAANLRRLVQQAQ